MWNTPTQHHLAQIPKLYTTENIPVKEKLVYLHFFLAGCDWYVCEFDGNDTFWGFTILNNDLRNAEWGYFTINKLDRLNVRGLEIDMDLYWEVRAASKVNKISQAQGWIQQANPLNRFNNAVL